MAAEDSPPAAEAGGPTPMPVTVVQPVAITSNGNGGAPFDGILISRDRRDFVFSLALVIALSAVVAMGVGSFLAYPQYEVGVTSAFFTLSNIASYLLGMKSSSTMPPTVSVSKSTGSPE